jgi:hypothetical protein
MTRYWKILDENGRSCHGGSFQWSLPRWSKTRGWIPGDWTPAIPNLRMCERGYHVCRDEHLVTWLHARIYACEIRGASIEADDKLVVESVRLIAPTPWDETSARLFAVECAANCLDEYEKRYPGDLRVSDCIEVAMRLALGEATGAERSAASSARSAASSARSAASSAESAAWSAARSAQTERLLWWIGAA